MEVEEGEPTDLGMVLPPSTVRQWLLVGILRGEIIAHISELCTLNLPFGLGFDENLLSHELHYPGVQMFF